MKRLLGLVILFVVLSVCVPSYGYFLIYNVSGSVKGVNNTTPGSISWKAYLVLNLDNVSGDITDANLVIYGKDSSKAKVYVQFNNAGTAPLISSDLWQQGDIMVLNVWDYTDPFDFEGLILGKVSAKNIGLVNTVLIPGSMKGTMMIWDGRLFDVSDQIAGTGNVSATLNSSYTKGVNGTNPTWTQDQIIEGQSISGKMRGVKPDLEAKGYTNATPVVP
jgi:hypothetical protein